MVKREKIKSVFKKLKNGKQEYFDEFYKLTKTSVYFTVRKFSRDEFFIEDAMQDAYVSFLKNICSVKDDPLPYLIVTAKNKALDRIRLDGKIDKTVEIENLVNATEDTYKSDFPLLNKCREILSDEEFFILENVAILGYRQTEVAEMLGKPLTTVNYNYKIILKKLRTIKKEAYI